MKFLKALAQKKLAKAVMCGLVVSGGMVVGMGQADAATWGIGATKFSNSYRGTGEVKIIEADTQPSADTPEILGQNPVYGNYDGKGTVTIEGGTIKGSVYGGSKADGCTVNICGGIFNSAVNGAKEAEGNTINIIGKGGNLDGLENKGIIEVVKYISGSNTSRYSNNTLNVAGTGTTAGNISNFQNLNFILPAGVTKGDDMLTLTAGDATELNKVEKITVTAANGVKLNKDDTVNLIHKTGDDRLLIWVNYAPTPSVFDNEGNVNPDYSQRVVIASPLTATSGKITMEALDEDAKRNDLVFTALEDISIADDTPEGKELADKQKSHVETRANAAALLNEGADFMMDQGMASAKAAAKEGVKEGSRELAPFVAVGAGNMRYKTGSHVDSKSWHAGVGVSKQVGDMMYGIAVEHGKSNYDSYVNAVHGEGDSKATGGTVFAEMKKDSGVHYDAAVRAGRVKNDYSCAAIGSSYNESSTYYGMSIGGGKEFAVSDKDAVDVYGRYYWAHTNSSDVTVAGAKLSFDAVNSHRTRLGSRYTHTVNDMSKLYAGLVWQYEFSGKAKATVDGDAAPAPSLKGNSGMLELGWKVEASKNMAIDLNMSGWTGKQRGVMGGVNMQWKF